MSNVQRNRSKRTKTTTPTPAVETTAARTNAEQRAIDLEHVRAILGEMTTHLQAMAYLFAVCDAELDSGNYADSPPARRASYNHAEAGVAEGLMALEGEFETMGVAS